MVNSVWKICIKMIRYNQMDYGRDLKLEGWLYFAYIYTSLEQW